MSVAAILRAKQIHESFGKMVESDDEESKASAVTAQEVETLRPADEIKTPKTVNAARKLKNDLKEVDIEGQVEVSSSQPITP